MNTTKSVFIFLCSLFWLNTVIAAPVTISEITSARSSATLKEVWLSGSSSSVYSIFRGFSLVCDDNSVSVFNAGAATTAQRPGAVNAGDLLAYACKRGATVVIAYHSVEGGSYNAYLPHFPANSIPNLPGKVVLRRLKALDNSTCVLASGSLNIGTDNNAVSVYRSCSIVTPSASTVVTEVTATLKPPSLPAGGYSDVEFQMNALGGSTSLSQNNGTEVPLNLDLVFGLAVSTNLYRTLQVAQNIYSSTAVAATSDPSFDPAFAPNIKSSLYNSLAASLVADWSGVLGNAGAGKKILVARRNNTSGTQASSNTFFLRDPCARGVSGSMLASRAIDTTPTNIITEDTSSSRLKATLSNATAANEFAIGVLSLENNWRTDIDNNQYRFVKLDGVHPEAGDIVTARASIVSGQYDYIAEVYSFVANTAANTYSATLINDISTALTEPTDCNKVSRGTALNPLRLFNGSTTCQAQSAKISRLHNSCSPAVWVY